MGDNKAYTIFEALVVGLFDQGTLDRDGVDLIGRTVAEAGGGDVDYGGTRDLKSKEGLTAEEIAVSLAAPKAWAKAQKLSVKANRGGDSPRSEALEKAFHELSRKRWKWW